MPNAPGVDLGPITLLLMVVFALSGAYVAVGNFVLFVIMKQRGSRLNGLFGGLAVAVYFCDRRAVRSKKLDRFAVSVAASVPITILAVVLLFPRIWGPMMEEDSRLSSPGYGSDYFPSRLFSEDSTTNEQIAATTAQYLDGLGEGPLIGPRTSSEIYRVLWIPAKEPAVLVKVTISDRSVLVARFQDLSRQKPPTFRTLRLSQKAASELDASLTGAGFWTSLENRVDPPGRRLDGGPRCVIEGLRQGSYKVVQRALPRVSRPGDRDFLRAAKAILRAGAVEIHEFR